jgi:hypothetical protein
MKYRLQLSAGIEEAETPTFLNGGLDSERESWIVERLEATFLFETKESLYSFIKQFSLSLGARAPK